MSVRVRPLQTDEVSLVQPLATRAFDALRTAQDRPVREVTAEHAAAYSAIHAHLQRTDPAGCLLAELDGAPVGVALSYRRGDLWLLSLLVVEPGRQGAGAGTALLQAALRDAPPHATTDSRALRAYLRAGLRPLRRCSPRARRRCPGRRRSSTRR